MKKVDYLRMKTEDLFVNNQISNDWTEMKMAIMKLASDTIKLGGLSVSAIFFQWLASFAAIYLLVTDDTNWRTNILTGLLVPYIFFSLPGLLFGFLRGQVGIWIAFIAGVLCLFSPHHFPGWLEIPGAISFIIAVAPDLIADNIRDNWIGGAVCLVIGCCLFEEHFRGSGGFRNSSTRANGIFLLLVYPVWYLITYSL